MAFVPPRNALESALTNMWKTMLHVHPISVSDNFFELGGDSLAALQVLARVEDAFGKSLPPAALFRSPTRRTTCLDVASGRSAGILVIVSQASLRREKEAGFLHPV